MAGSRGNTLRRPRFLTVAVPEQLEAAGARAGLTPLPDTPPVSAVHRSRAPSLTLRPDRGVVGPCDDGASRRSEKTAHRKPRSGKDFETAHGEGTNL